MPWLAYKIAWCVTAVFWKVMISFLLKAYSAKLNSQFPLFGPSFSVLRHLLLDLSTGWNQQHKSINIYVYHTVDFHCLELSDKGKATCWRYGCSKYRVALNFVIATKLDFVNLYKSTTQWYSTSVNTFLSKTWTNSSKGWIISFVL